ncbi:hypothetical protein DXG01_004473 [Tephrocybe rancida]|nr:hypothetical protein DXG01_004473 [Tephrocybe rancida]
MHVVKTKVIEEHILTNQQTVPQRHAANQTINLSSGKILGGDSAVNGLVWVRGAREEYDAFANLGSPGWNWDRFYLAMKRAETLEEPSQELVDDFGFVIKPSTIGSTGPVNVSFPAFLPIQHQKLINASIQLGHVFNTDAYGGNNSGVFYSLSSEAKSSVRVTSEFAYVDPVISRKNLVILYNGALVTSLTVTGTSIVKASGVTVRFPDGTKHSANLKATGEVVLSAGTIRTPQLLELSGIGDKRILAPLEIKVKVDLPGVGANYEDQLKEPYESFDALSYDPALKAQQEELYKQGKGWLTFANAVLNMSPVNKVLSREEITKAEQILEEKPPTIQRDLFDSIKSRVFSVPQAEYLLFNSFSAGPVKEANRSYVSMAITHLHPLSRGSIQINSKHIGSTSIDDHPLINPNLLESEWDRWFLAKATAYARKFFQTPAFLEIFDEEVYPTATNTSTDAQWETFVKATVNCGYHSVGTSSLLPRSKNGVVDANLTVYGTKNIRVVDVSILPLLLSAHTQPAAYAIGEIGATIIMGR